MIIVSVLSVLLLGCDFQKRTDDSNQKDSEMRGSHREPESQLAEASPRPPIRVVQSKPLCDGSKIGMYVWDQAHWRDPSPEKGFLKHLSTSHARRLTCGDIFINVADYSSALQISDSNQLVPFILQARKAGNLGVIWLTYGDVTEKDSAACKAFVNTFFTWVDTIPDNLIRKVIPIGLSYDIENFPVDVITDTLVSAQKRKKQLIHKFGNDGLLIQCTIDGQIRPLQTDAIMKHADRALAMAYRNYIYSTNDPDGTKNGLLQQLTILFKEQCVHCLDDLYATENYRAEITVMVETACKMGKSCSFVSFCAYDGAETGGVDYLSKTLRNIDELIVSSGLMSSSQKERLFSKSAPYAVHDWDWFQCFYRVETDTNPKCKTYASYAKACRSM